MKKSKNNYKESWFMKNMKKDLENLDKLIEMNPIDLLGREETKVYPRDFISAKEEAIN